MSYTYEDFDCIEVICHVFSINNDMSAFTSERIVAEISIYVY